MTLKRRPLTAAHLEPWRGTVVDLTMADGTHRIGRVESIERGSVQLRGPADSDELPGDGLVRLAEAVTVGRAPRR
jgi:hypothetical protein